MMRRRPRLGSQKSGDRKKRADSPKIVGDLARDNDFPHRTLRSFM
jgi:hypothetical protein